MAPGDDLAKEGARKNEENENCRSEFSKKERKKCTQAKKREVFSSAALQGPSHFSLPGKSRAICAAQRRRRTARKGRGFLFLWRVPFRSGDKEWKRGPVCIPSTLYSRYGRVHFKALISTEEEENSVQVGPDGAVQVYLRSHICYSFKSLPALLNMN